MEAQEDVSSEFSSALTDDTPETLLFHSTLGHLLQGLKSLQALPPGSDPEKRSEHARLVALQREVVQRLHVHFAPDGEQGKPLSFGQTLRRHRDEAGLTQEQLASYAGLSLSYVRKLEQDRKPPVRRAVLALCSVPDLKLNPAEIMALPALREAPHKQAPNWYVSPGFDSVQMLGELAQQINGGGGALEQTHVYMDHKSASDWIQLCNAPTYVAAFRESLPHGEVAKRIRELTGQAGLDLIALGPGDGKCEVRLVQHILEESERPSIRFYLVDASQPLLSRAFKHAVDTLGDDPGVFVCGIQGNFHHLPRYTQLHYAPARSHRRRVYVMLGATLGNLDNELQFFQNAFAAAVPGDLLVFDVTYAFTASSDPEDIKRADPALSRPVPDGFQQWLAGPIRRYCRDAQDITFSYRLDLNRPIAGSYGIQFIAEVGLPGRQTREFCMFQVRRYDPASLVRCMGNLGWNQVGQIQFLGTKTRPGVFLFQKGVGKR